MDYTYKIMHFIISIVERVPLIQGFRKVFTRLVQTFLALYGL